MAAGHLTLTHWSSERDTNIHLDNGHRTGGRGKKRRKTRDLLACCRLEGRGLEWGHLRKDRREEGGDGGERERSDKMKL